MHKGNYEEFEDVPLVAKIRMHFLPFTDLSHTSRLNGLPRTRQAIPPSALAVESNIIDQVFFAAKFLIFVLELFFRISFSTALQTLLLLV